MMQHYDFGIVDELWIPADLAPGKYTLSWRWDVEQSPQVWSNCADVNILPPYDKGRLATPPSNTQLAANAGNSPALQVATGVIAAFAVTGTLVWFITKRVSRRGEDSYGLL